MNKSAQSLKFIVIGVLSTALYFFLLILLEKHIGSTIILTFICYLISMFFNFIAQGLFTFQVQKFTKQQVRRYLILQGSNLVFNSAAMAVLLDGLTINILVAQVGVTACLTIYTYLVSRAWVYV